MKEKPLTIGVCGGSGAGKTTLADGLCDRFPAGAILRIPHDAYYRNLDHMAPDLRSQVNFDHPDALDTQALVKDIQLLCDGQSVEIPVYDFSSHKRAGTRKVQPGAVILLDGILIFSEPGLRELLDIKVFVDVDEDLRLSRRLVRDIRERGRDLESVLAQYNATVRPMHRNFVRPSRDFADLVVTNGRNSVVIDLLAARIREHLGLESWPGGKTDAG